jgi:hypothetical protein
MTSPVAATPPPPPVDLAELARLEAAATVGEWFFDGYCRVQSGPKIKLHDEWWTEERFADGHTYEHHAGNVCPSCGPRFMDVGGKPAQVWDCALAGEALDVEPTVCHVTPSYGDTARGQRAADAEFIAAIRNAAPRLIAALEAVQRVRGLCDGYRANCSPDTIQAQVAELFRLAMEGDADA